MRGHQDGPERSCVRAATAYWRVHNCVRQKGPK